MPDQQVRGKLRANANMLFELDDTSRIILGNIAERGPSTIYELDKIRNLSKAAISRRLKGDANLLSLLGENYLRLEGSVAFNRIKGRMKKYYGLTLKGFLASLSNVDCDRNYMFKILLQTLCDTHAWKEAKDHWTQVQTDKILETFRRRAAVDLLLFFQYHVEQGLKLTHIKHPEMYFGRFWDFVEPYSSQTDPYSEGSAQFSTTWNVIWNTREQVDPKMPIYTHVSRVSDVSSRVEESVESFPSTGPWVGTFPLCWLTENEVNSWAPHPDWGFVDALLHEYQDVIRRLRGSDPPWDPGILIVGRPIRELEKERLEWSEALKRGLKETKD